MRVALCSFWTRGAMGHLLQVLLPALSQRVELHAFLPPGLDVPAGRVQVHRLPLPEHRAARAAALCSPWRAAAAWRAIEEARPDLLHIFTGESYPWTLLWLARARRTGLRVVLTIHDPDPHPGSAFARWYHWAGGAALRRADGFHVMAEDFTGSISRRGADPDRIFVIPHGSVAQCFLPHRAPGVEREPDTILFFGRLSRYKGLDVLLTSLDHLPARFRLIVAGPGRLTRHQAEVIHEAGHRVELHNRFVADAEAARLMQRAAVCVLPYTQATQSSLPLLAAAFGVPVVASAVGALRQDVPQVGGILVPPSDPAALAGGIVRALGTTPTHPPGMEYAVLSGSMVAWYERVCQLPHRHQRQMGQGANRPSPVRDRAARPRAGQP